MRSVTPSESRDLYLDLLKRVLTRTGFDELAAFVPDSNGKWTERLLHLFRRWLLLPRQLDLVRISSQEERRTGGDWPLQAETMVGLFRLDNLQNCIERVLEDDVPGDFIETGVWRGGASIFMRGVFKAHGVQDRLVYCADSFAGLPKPDSQTYPIDADDRHWTHPELAVSLEEVKANFKRYGMLDDQIRFLVGWFRDTLPTAPMDQLAILRLDGDMYESTWVAFENLYPKLSVGGFVIVDDYGIPAGCAEAVEEFRRRNGISEPIEHVDRFGAFWRRVR